MDEPRDSGLTGGGAFTPPPSPNPRTAPPAPPAPPQEPEEPARNEPSRFEQVGEPIVGVQPETLDDLPDFIPAEEREDAPAGDQSE